MRIPRPSRLRAVVAALLVACAALAGCATRQVERVVERSNAVLLPGSALPGWDGASPDAATLAVEQIEEVIAAHPDEPALTEPLRVRQAMVLASAGHRDLAEAVLDGVPREHLHSERDRALHELRAYLPWWFERSKQGTFSNDDLRKADEALAAFARTCDALPAGSDVRVYLEEMRAWIAVVRAKQGAVGDAAGLLASAAERYASVLDPADFGAPAEAAAPAASSAAVRLRRRLRPPFVLRAMRDAARAQGVEVAWRPGWLAAWMARQP